MESKKATRKRRQDTKHAVYMLVNTNTNEAYIGITVCGNDVKKALKVRFQKHVRRAVTENKTWALCRSIREHGADAFEMEVIGLVRGRKDAHTMERGLIAELCPALNHVDVDRFPQPMTFPPSAGCKQRSPQSGKSH